MYLLEHLVQLHSVDNYVEVFRNNCRYQECIMLNETSPSLYIQLLANPTLYYNLVLVATTLATHKYLYLLYRKRNICVKKKIFFLWGKFEVFSLCKNFSQNNTTRNIKIDARFAVKFCFGWMLRLGEAATLPVFMQFIYRVKLFVKWLFIRCRRC